MRIDAINWAEKKSLSLPFMPRLLAHRTIWASILSVMILQAVAAGVVLVSLQGSWREQARIDHAELIGQLAAEQLFGRDVGPGDVFSHSVLDRLVKTNGVSFAAILDAEGKIVMGRPGTGLHGQVFSPTEHVSPAASHIPANQIGTSEAEDSGGMLATLEKWFSPLRRLYGPVLAESPLVTPRGNQTHRLVIAVDDRSGLRAVVDGLIALIVSLLVVAAILIPMAYRRFGAWATGLGQLHRAFRTVAQGAEPKPLPITGTDEIAYLTVAFNEMASQLIASRRALQRTNEELEKRVEHRTEQLRAAALEMEQLASSDMLTGLANRRALAQRLLDMFKSAVDTESDLVCIAIDLDGFKAVNDTLGHVVGDEILQIAGDVFRANCRSGDLAARMGGDEFIVLMPIDGPQAAVPIVERLLRQFGERCEAHLKEFDVPNLPSMSVGIASRKLLKAEKPDQLLQAADAALYRAKDQGKNRLQIWDESFGPLPAIERERRSAA